MSDIKKPSKAAAPSKRIMDVAHPGKSAPSSTSKPVIVTNRPIMKDPMMTEDSDVNTGNEVKIVGTSAKIKIQPLTAPVVEAADPEQETIEVKTSSKPMPEPPPPAPEAAEEPEPAEKEVDTPKPEPETPPAEASKPADTKDDQPEADDKVSEKADAAESED
ncbi:MAG TPA: hypothetical protein VN778_01120, partial [Verrucomicrobiae bacterium]|nr:hypothetical protein [Verrucomicrobiae bacterium]